MFLPSHLCLLPPLAPFLFVSEFCQELLAHQHRPSATFAGLPARQDEPFFSLEEVILKKQPALLDPSSLPQTIPHRILPSRSNWAPLKSRVVMLLFALFPSSQDPELHHLMVTAAKAAPDLHSHKQIFTVPKCCGLTPVGG